MQFFSEFRATSIRVLTLSLLGVALPLTATGCSSSGGNANNNAAAPRVSATSSRLTANPVAGLPADGTTSAEITVVVLDDASQPLAGQQVDLQVSGTGNTVAPNRGTTDGTGAFRATLTSTTAEQKDVQAIVNFGSGSSVTLAQRARVTFVNMDTPRIRGVARYEDSNRNGALDQNDALILSFTSAVTVSSSLPADLAMLVQGDSLGTGASLQSGPANDEVTVLLGASPVLRARGMFSAQILTANSPSGIDVSSTVQGILSASSGTPAAASTAVDIVPALHRTAATGNAADASAVDGGDLDGDGDVDLWVAEAGADRVLLRNADGTYSDTMQFGSDPTSAVAIANLDRFAAADIVTAHPGFVQIWLNRSTNGQLDIRTGTTVAAPQTRALAVADVTGDGFNDVVTGGPDDVRVFRNGRNLGVSMTLEQTITLADVRALAAFDVDADGDIDVIAGTGANVVLLRNSNGTLAAPVTLDNQPGTDLGVGDVDGDGGSDVLASDGSTARLLSNDRTGAFVVSALSIPATRLAVGDLDNDARADLVTKDGNGIGIHFASTSAAGSASFVTDAQRLSGDAQALLLFDEDRDGDLDLAAALATEIRIHDGSERGSFGTVTFAADGTQQPSTSRAVASGDLDGDGDDDLVVVGDGTDVVLRNDGSGSFSVLGQLTQLGNGLTSAVAIADMDADGDLDIVTVERFMTGTNSVWRVHLNDGNASFNLGRNLPHDAADDAQAVALGDVNDDGSVDVVVGCNGANRVLRNINLNGQQTFFLVPNAFNPTVNNRDTRALALFDIDGEGDLDLVVANFGSEQAGEANQIFRLAVNNNLPSFNEFPLLGNEPSVGVTVGDLDNDGFIDVLFANRDNGNNFQHRIHRIGLRTTQAIGQPIRFTSGSPASSLAAADVDGDELVDLVMGTTDGKVQIWRQTGALQFSVVQELNLADVTAVAASDVDRDGDADAFAATLGADTLLRNR